jgi:serine carboxypeptidase-like clade 2
MTIFNSYEYSEKGSYLTIPKLLQNGLKVFLYSGDWDDVVPFTDSYMNINKMGVKLLGNPEPWKVGSQHAGFIKNYSNGLKFYLVKGAGHEVPLYQRERSYNVFQSFLLA